MGEVIAEGRTVRPAPVLRSLVAFYSGYRQTGRLAGSHRGLPSPYVTMILTLDEPLWLAETHGGAPARRYDALIGGLHTTPAHVVHDGSQAGLQLGLTPLGARTIFHVPAGILAGIDVHAEDVLGPSIGLVREQLMEAPSWDERFGILDRWLLGLIDETASMGPEVTMAWDLLSDPSSALRIADIARAVGWTERHLRNRVTAGVGLSPKVAARVVRFDHARRLLQRQVRCGRGFRLADLAATCGYADQAHLAREFRDFAGCSPSTWIADEFPNVQAVSDPRGDTDIYERHGTTTSGLARPSSQ
jgi:AraC-like DNA-binding protein